MSKVDRKPNRLIDEKSPYLRQHAYNPVDWHPWGAAAFERARREDKPILLSIGYSTCHWCHVMERESFSDPKLAEVLNGGFVAIKVDREERPDVDCVYMSAVQVLTGQGGWPLNAFLTPDLKPFYGGTYFPPEPRFGQPGFAQILARIAELWKTRRDDLASDAGKVAEALRAYAQVSGRAAPLDAAWSDAAFRSFQESFDGARGGFGGAPKFPMPVNLAFLLRYRARTGEDDALDMVLLTLHKMAAGGLCDQLGGGFHRYSVDAEWFVPHFEKMLYDNAQLASSFLEAAQASGDAELGRAARRALAYLERDLRHPEGAFFSGEDADSLPPELAAEGAVEEGHERKTEGAFYLWTEAEVRAVLGSEAAPFLFRHSVQPEGNVALDPHGEFRGKNILAARRTIEETARSCAKTLTETSALLDRAREKLLAARALRPRPSLDDNILASWNGLAISAFAKGYQVLGEGVLLERATEAAEFLRSRLYEPGALFHDGERAVRAFADDYAFVAQGCLDLFEAGFEPRWLAWALELCELALERCAGEDGGFYMTAEGEGGELLARVMEDHDNVEPAASSVMAVNLLRLAQYTGRGDLRRAAEKTLELFGARMKERPRGLPLMLTAVERALGVAGERAFARPMEVLICGEPASSAAFIKEVRSRFLPNAAVILVHEGNRVELEKLCPWLKDLKPKEGKATAFVCVGRACELPVTEPAEFARLLDKK